MLHRIKTVVLACIMMLCIGIAECFQIDFATPTEVKYISTEWRARNPENGGAKIKELATVYDISRINIEDIDSISNDVKYMFSWGKRANRPITMDTTKELYYGLTDRSDPTQLPANKILICDDELHSIKGHVGVIRGICVNVTLKDGRGGYIAIVDLEKARKSAADAVKQSIYEIVYKIAITLPPNVVKTLVKSFPSLVEIKEACIAINVAGTFSEIFNYTSMPPIVRLSEVKERIDSLIPDAALKEAFEYIWGQLELNTNEYERKQSKQYHQFLEDAIPKIRNTLILIHICGNDPKLAIKRLLTRDWGGLSRDERSFCESMRKGFLNHITKHFWSMDVIKKECGEGFLPGRHRNKPFFSKIGGQYIHGSVHYTMEGRAINAKESETVAEAVLDNVVNDLTEKCDFGFDVGDGKIAIKPTPIINAAAGKYNVLSPANKDQFADGQGYEYVEDLPLTENVILGFDQSTLNVAGYEKQKGLYCTYSPLKITEVGLEVVKALCFVLHFVLENNTWRKSGSLFPVIPTPSPSP